MVILTINKRETKESEWFLPRQRIIQCKRYINKNLNRVDLYNELELPSSIRNNPRLQSYMVPNG